MSIAVALLVANIWEEGTWLGFMQTRLERRHGFFAAAALTAVPFAAVHLPLRVINGSATTPAELISAFAILVVFCFFVRTLLGTVARGASNSVLLAAVTHTMFNRSNNGGGLGDDLLAGPNRQLAALMAAVLLTVVLVVVNRRRAEQVLPPRARRPRAGISHYARTGDNRQEHDMIQVEALTKRYGDKTAVDDLSFEVRPGMVTGFLGPTAPASPRPCG